MRRYSIRAIATAFLLIIGCNSEENTVTAYIKRINRISALSESNNRGSYQLNSLDDSLKIISSDLRLEDLSKENFGRVASLIDSIGLKIHQRRLINCIVGQEFSRDSTYQTSNAKIQKSAAERNIFARQFLEGRVTIRVKINEHGICDIKQDYPDFNGGEYLWIKILLGALEINDLLREDKTTTGTYRYIGNDEFEVSNGWIIKVTDPENCMTTTVD